ncbi:hypothetical protein [Dyella acidiphila]|uniref:Uncharacterized protein n=1 Tax=Dyella acidiphila TaxID=2775866 RepID=A0ABR9GA77_9GAMM|nr:hypothetical protein [Dyella acidiphila]MBE1160935.1 hypothetical protein [Dyella acidiphila]
MTFARIDELTRSALALCLWLIAVTLNMAAVLWLGFQIVRWLHDGHWTAQPTVMFWIQSYYPDVMGSLSNPHSWYGAAKMALVLARMPSGLALVCLGMVCAALNVSVYDRRPEAPRVTKSRAAASF